MSTKPYRAHSSSLSPQDSWDSGQDIHLFYLTLVRNLIYRYFLSHVLINWNRGKYSLNIIKHVCTCANQKTRPLHPLRKEIMNKITYKYWFSFVALFKQQLDGKQGSLYKETYTGRQINPCTYNNIMWHNLVTATLSWMSTENTGRCQLKLSV